MKKPLALLLSLLLITVAPLSAATSVSIVPVIGLLPPRIPEINVVALLGQAPTIPALSPEIAARMPDLRLVVANHPEAIPVQALLALPAARRLEVAQALEETHAAGNWSLAEVETSGRPTAPPERVHAAIEHVLSELSWPTRRGEALDTPELSSPPPILSRTPLEQSRPLNRQEIQSTKRALWLNGAFLSGEVSLNLLTTGSDGIRGVIAHDVLSVGILAMPLIVSRLLTHLKDDAALSDFQRTQAKANLALSLVLGATMAYTLWNAVAHLISPVAVAAFPTLGVGLFAIAPDVLSVIILGRQATANPRLRAAAGYFLANLIGGLGVVISSLLNLTFHIQWADPIAGLVIVALLANVTARMASQSLRALRA